MPTRLELIYLLIFVQGIGQLYAQIKADKTVVPSPIKF